MTTPVDTVRRFYDALGRRGREPCDTDHLTREELAMTYRAVVQMLEIGARKRSGA